MLGQRVATLIDQYLDAGEYKAVWQADNNPSGIYFSKLSGTQFTQSAKMILLK
jgi:hypothetical protein